MCMTSPKASAYDIAVANDDGVTIYYNYSNDGKELTVTHFSKYSGSVNIPESVVYMNRTRNVTGIGENAFSGCSNLTSITIPKTVTSIGQDAFSGCTHLVTVNITDLTAWCNITFAGPSSLYYKYHTDTNSNPLKYAKQFFLNGEEIVNLVIPDDISFIESDAFLGCKSLTSVTIPINVTKINDRAFRGCSNLSYLKISDGVENIGKYAFSNCTKLKQIDMGKNVSSVDCAAFENCRNINKLIIPDIKNWCGIDFSYIDYTYVSYTANPIWDNNDVHIYSDEQTEIEHLIIPEGTTTINYGVFWGCKNLKSVIIPNSVTSINSRAFQSSSINTVSLGSGIKSIGWVAFSGCPLTSIRIPRSVVSIGDEAFRCNLETVITEIEIPFKISDDTFSSNTFFNATLYVPRGKNTNYKSTEGWKKFVWIEEGEPYELKYIIDNEVYKTCLIEKGEVIIPEPAPTKDGYSFSGWSEIPETMPAHDMTVTGSFTVNSYKLTYMIDDKVYKETMYEYGATITPESQPEGEYATFEWIDLPQTMPAHDVVVYASYTSGIIEVRMTTQRNIRIYSPNGKKLDKLQKGLNIVVLDDGTVKKVVVK